MSLDSYTNLKSEISDWMVRADIAGTADTFIDLFEAWANRNLRVRQMEAESTSSASEYMALPDDFLELRDIQYQANPRVQLQYVTPEYADLYDTSGTSGTPKFYTLVGNEIRLIPAPDASTSVRISYWGKITALSGSNETNWLLTAYPDAYLYGPLMHARAWIHDQTVAAIIQSQWAVVMDEIQRAGKKSNVGGSMKIRPV